MSQTDTDKRDTTLEGEIRITKSSYEYYFYKFKPRLFSHALKILKEDALAKDAVSQLFERLWKNRDKLHFEEEKFFLNYLYSGIVMEVRATQRKLVRDAKRLNDYKMEDGHVASPEESFIQAEIVAAILEIVRQLPGQVRIVMELKLSGIANEGIAKEMNITEATVRSHYRTAREILQEKMANNPYLGLSMLLLGLCEAIPNPPIFH